MFYGQGKIKGIIVDKCSTEEDKSECVHKNIKKKANNEAEYEESLVTDEELSYFNIFECGRNPLNRLDVTHERAYMATLKDKYFEKMLENLVDHNDCHNARLSDENIRQAVSKVMAETEDE